MSSRRVMGCALYLGAALALAAALVYLPRPTDPMAAAHYGDKLAALGLAVTGLVSPIVVIGVIVTACYLWSRHPVLRKAYLIVLFVVLVGDFTLLMADGWTSGFLTCWDCDGPLLLARFLLPGSLFMVIASLVILPSASQRTMRSS